jgi:hypothetical protein
VTKLSFPDPEDPEENGDEGGNEDRTFLGLDRQDWQYMVTKSIISLPICWAIIVAAFLLSRS